MTRSIDEGRERDRSRGWVRDARRDGRTTVFDDVPRTTRANNIIRTRLRSRFRSVDVARASVRASITHHRAMMGAVTTTRSNRARARPGGTDDGSTTVSTTTMTTRMDPGRENESYGSDPIARPRRDASSSSSTDRISAMDRWTDGWGWWIWITPIDRSNGRDPRGGGTRGTRRAKDAYGAVDCVRLG